MQKKKARKGFLFLRRESVLPPCRAGPVCPAGTNAVFCGGTHGSRPTDRCGKPSVGDGVPYTPCHCAPVRAAKQVPLGYRLARQSVSGMHKFALLRIYRNRHYGFPRRFAPRNDANKSISRLRKPGISRFGSVRKHLCRRAFSVILSVRVHRAAVLRCVRRDEG